MTSRWFRCKTCNQAISADAPVVSCPSCGDDTRRVDVSKIDSKADRCVFMSPGTTGERRAMSSIVEEIGRDAEWIRSATIAVGDGRVSPAEARGLLLSLRRHFAAARPLIEVLSDVANERKQMPVDLDDLDGVGDADRFPPEDEGRPATAKEAFVIWCIMITGTVIFAGLLGLAWIFRGSMAGWGW
jgi:predicted RNA-binding Zn-ribbon protein involved in translation (DUF1610 family)